MAHEYQSGNSLLKSGNQVYIKNKKIKFLFTFLIVLDTVFQASRSFLKETVFFSLNLIWVVSDVTEAL